MQFDPVQLASDLVRFRSITPADDGAQAWLAGKLSSLGFTCTNLPFGNILNLFARLDGDNSGNGGPHFCFCGHTDVVPPGDESSWTYPPFEPTVANGNLYGRGTADMKANITCFVAAVAVFIEKHGAPKGSISLLITGDEEKDAIDGTVKVLEWMKDNSQLADDYLVGEPSNPKALGDELKIGRRGSLSGRLIVTGVQGHSAYPERADNPLPKLVKLLDVLENHVFDAGSAHFPATNLEITTIDTGNTADNVIPAKGTAKFNVRFNDRWTAKTLEEEIRRKLDGCNIAYDLTCSSNAESFLTKPGIFTNLVSRAVEDVTGRKPALATGGGTSDARFVSAYGPVVEFGLLNTVIHKVDEHVAVDDLHRLTAIYTRTLELYFNVQ